MKKLVALTTLAILLVMTPIASEAANSVGVTEGAAMQGTFGLNLHLDDPASTSSTQAYLMAGPDKGFNNESTLKGSFFINPQNLTASMTVGQSHFQLMLFYEHFSDASGVKLIFFLHRDEVSGNWFITVWHYNDVVGNYVFTGNGFFALYGSAFFDENKIDFEWTAGNPGTLTMYRTLYVNGVPDASGKIQMFSAPTPGMGTAGINYVFVGMLNPLSHHPGTYGDLHLDEFVFTR